MEVSIENTKEDYLKFFKISFWERLKKIGFFLVPLIAICLYNYSINVANSNFPVWLLLIFQFGCFVGFLFLLYFIRYLMFFIKLNKSIAKNPQVLGKINVSLTNEGIEYKYLSEVRAMAWKELINPSKNEDFISVRFSNRQGFLIPIRFFRSKHEAQIFYNRIVARR